MFFPRQQDRLTLVKITEEYDYYSAAKRHLIYLTHQRTAEGYFSDKQIHDLFRVVTSVEPFKFHNYQSERKVIYD